MGLFIDFDHLGERSIAIIDILEKPLMVEDSHESLLMEGRVGLHLPVRLVLRFVIMDVLDPDGCGDIAQINRIILGPPLHFICLGLVQVPLVLPMLGIADLPTYLPLHFIYLEENVRFLKMPEVPQLFLAVAQVLLQTYFSALTGTSLKYRFVSEQPVEGVTFSYVGMIFLAEEGLDTERLVVIVTETLYYHDPILSQPPAIVREVPADDGSAFNAGREGVSLGKNLCLHYNI